jgi:outer membrane receptor protein involved in Fe transport
MGRLNNKIREYTQIKLAVTVAAISTAMSAAPCARAAQLEEVLVTAQKRVESLQDVPISVVAVSGETVEEQGLVNMEAVSASIPTLHIGESTIGEQLFIRGIGSGVNAGFEQSVGTFIDGIYYGRGRSSRNGLFDVERIEVLKGPQGSLFGKNTIAGALNITTAKPTDEFEGSLTGLYEFEQEETILSGVISGPLTDSISGRVAAQWSKMDAGWIDNEFRGEDEPTPENTVVRSSLSWDASEKLTVDANYTYSDFEQEGRNSELSDANGKYPGAPFVGNMAQLLAPFGEFGKLDEKRNVGGSPGSLYDRDKMESDANAFVLTVNYDWGDHLLTSISGYTDYDLTDATDQDITPLDILAMQIDENYEQYSQELRLASPGGETFDYILGAYYQYDELDTEQMINVNLLDVIYGSPVPGVVPPDYFGPPLFSARYAHMYQETTSWSVFSQVTWNITDTVRTTVGLRYADDEKKVDQELRLTEFNDRNTPLASIFPPASGVAPGFVQVDIWGGPPLRTFEHQINDKKSKDNVTGSVNVQWDVTEDAMVYASVSTGYKSGGFDASFGGAQGDFTSSPEDFDFDQEEVTAYEIGAKMSLLDGAAELNMAAFYNEFDDVQVSTFDGGLALKVGNAAETTVEGVEIDGRWAMTDSFTLSGAVAYVDASYDNFPNAQCYFGQDAVNPDCVDPDGPTGPIVPVGQDMSGKDLQFSPDWAAHLALEHYLSLGSLELRTLLSADYSDEYAIAADLDPRSIQDSYTKVNLRIGLSDIDGTWELAFIGRNLTDEDTASWANDTPLAPGGFYHQIDRLRSYALQARYNF